MSNAGELGVKEKARVRRKAEVVDDVSDRVANSNDYGGVSSAHYISRYRTDNWGDSLVHVEARDEGMTIVSLTYDVDMDSFKNVVYGNGKADDWMSTLRRIDISENVLNRKGLGKEVREIENLIKNCRLKYANGNL